ncbi:MAG: tetratricopeptide repeat protein [bacterium]
MFDIFNVKDPQKALQRAQELIREDKKEAAIKVLEDNLTEANESFDLFQELARLYYDVDERGRAVDLLRRLYSIVPSRVDEIIAQVSELYYRHTSIDAGEFLIQLYTSRHTYDEVSKVLLAMKEHEIKLLIKKYEKLRQIVENKKIMLKQDFDNIIILASLKFYIGAGEAAAASVEPLIELDVFKKSLFDWARILGRERYSDSHAAILLLRVQLANGAFEDALTQTQRIFEKFPEVSVTLIDILSAVKSTPELQPAYTQMLTDLYITQGDLDTSIDQLQQMLEKDTKGIDAVIKDLRKLEVVNPKDLKILYTLADAYLRAKRIPLAISELDKIFDIDKEQYDEVLRRYKQAFEQKQNDPFVIQGLVNLYLKHDEIDAAVDIIESVYRLDPGLLNEYILNLNTILAKDFDNAKALYLLGQCYARKGDRESALLIFRKLIDNQEYESVSEAAKEISAANPEDVDYVNLRAGSLVMLGKIDEALQILNDFLKVEPEKLVHLFPSFDLILSKKPEQFAQIEPIYRKYKREDPYVTELAMARAYAYVGAYRKSVNAFEQCFKIEGKKEVTKRALIEVIKERPDAVPLLLTAARAFISEGEMEIATQFFKTAQLVDPQAFFEIINEFYDAIKAFPKDREARTLLVETFFSRSLWDKAIEESRRAIDVFDKDAQYFNLKLGQSLVETGRLSEAVRPLMISLEGDEDYSAEVIEYLDKILKTDKSNVPAHFARGRALSKARRVDEAVDEYLLTAKILPSRANHVLGELKLLSKKVIAHPKVLFALGIIELSLKQHDAAISDLMKAVELDASLVRKVIPLFERLQEKISSPLLSFSLAKIYYIADLRGSAIDLFIEAQSQDKTLREPVIAEMKKICADNPQDIASRKGLADMYFGYRNWEDTLTLLEELYDLDKGESEWIKSYVGRILQADHHNIPSYNFLARIFVDEGSQDKAIEVYKKLVEMTPTEMASVVSVLSSYDEKTPAMLLYLGDLYTGSGYMEESVNIFEELFARDPSYADAIANRIENVLKKNADLGKAYLLQSRIYASQNDYGMAIQAIERVRQLMPEREDIILKQGQLLHESGATEKAIQLFTELLGKSRDRKAIYRMIKKARDDYYRERIDMLQGDEDNTRLERAHLYLMMGKAKEAEREMKFEPGDTAIAGQQTLLKARLYLKKKRPIDALEIVKTLPVNKETAETYADVYEAMGSFSAAALVLRQAGVEGVEQRISSFEKLAQAKRSTKGKYFVEGRT